MIGHIRGTNTQVMYVLKGICEIFEKKYMHDRRNIMYIRFILHIRYTKEKIIYRMNGKYSICGV